MDRAKLVGWSLAGGIVLTLLTGFVPVRTLAGGIRYGFPMAWLVRRVLAPGDFPWWVSWPGLVVDLVAWTAVVFAVLLVYERLRH